MARQLSRQCQQEEAARTAQINNITTAFMATNLDEGSIQTLLKPLLPPPAETNKKPNGKGKKQERPACSRPLQPRGLGHGQKD